MIFSHMLAPWFPLLGETWQPIVQALCTGIIVVVVVVVVVVVIIIIIGVTTRKNTHIRTLNHTTTGC